jgi:hypothetical protein
MVGTPAWFAWLEGTTTFAFTCTSGRFTARKEARSRGGWKAYHTSHGTLRRAYLGKTSDLTLDLLNSVAATLAAASVPKDPATPALNSTATPVAPADILAPKHNVPPDCAQLVMR